MQYGFVFIGGTPAQAVTLAQEAEHAGWDAFFVWETLYGMDAWAVLGAIAAKTQTIRIGTMLTPPSRMRPWKLASEVATVDQLSGGRVILSVGLGALETGFETFGEETGVRERAERLDESLEIMTRLWRGDPFSFDGQHYCIKDYKPRPEWNIRPVQQPHPPIWVVGLWHSERSMSRVARWQGLLPNLRVQGAASSQYAPDDVRAMRAWLDAHRSGDQPVEIIVEGKTPGDPDASARQIAPLVEAGASWWIEADWEQGDYAGMLARIRHGPPGGER